MPIRYRLCCNCAVAAPPAPNASAPANAKKARRLIRYGSRISRAAARGDLDLDLHARVDETADQHRRGGADRGEGLAEHRHDARPILEVRQVISDAHDIG